MRGGIAVVAPLWISKVDSIASKGVGERVDGKLELASSFCTGAFSGADTGFTSFAGFDVLFCIIITVGGDVIDVEALLGGVLVIFETDVVAQG